MIQKRINTDLFLHLSIVMKDGSPANFTGAQDMKVETWHHLYSNSRTEQAFKVEGNIISLQYSSEENQKTGKYGVSVFWSKLDPDSETGRRDYAVDFIEAFTIVPYSEQEDDGTIEYTGKVNQNPDGIGGTGDVDLSDYYNRKEVDDKLKKKVDAVDGKGLSECDFTKEEKDKLSGLSNYDDSELCKLVGEKAEKNSVYTKTEVDSKILASTSLITTDEQKVGILRYGGKDYTIYELTTEIKDLPILAGESIDTILSDQPCGNNLYLKVECLSVSSSNSFPISAYEVKRVFVDDQGNTVATIVCKEAVTGEPKALLTIRYVKGLLSFDTFELSIPVSELGITSVDDVTIEMPALKYNKKMAFSYAMDDGKVGVYEYFFKYTKEKNLCYTDGCGNDILFAFGNAWITYNYSGVDLHNSPQQINGMLWSNMIKILDFGGGIYNHGGGVYGDPTKEKTEELAQQSFDDNANAIRDKTGLYPFCVVIPGGDAEYQKPLKTVVDAMNTIYDNGSSGYGNYCVDAGSSLDLTQFKHGRSNYDTMFTNGDLARLKTHVQEAYNKYDHVLYYAFSHSPGRPDLEADQLIAANTVQPFLNWIYQTYGKGGDDSFWFASCNDIYEYLFTVSNSYITKKIAGDNLVLTVKQACLPNFITKDLTLILKSSGSIGSFVVDASDIVTGLSYGKQGDAALINVSLSTNRTGLAEKYTAFYETTLSNEAKEDALYMIGRLRKTLQEPYLVRLEAGAISPVLNYISINYGVETTFDRNVVVSFDVVGAITHYRIAETSDLSDITWIAGSANKQNYTLSANLGNKTVYVQVKNTVGESEIKSATITLQEKPVVIYTVTGRSNNADYGAVAPSTQEVAEGGTAHLRATANNGYLIESWEGTTSSTGVGEKSGTATVVNVKNDSTVTCKFKPESPAPVSIKMKLSLGEAYLANSFDVESGINRPMSAGGVKDILDTTGSKFGTVTAKIAKTSPNLFGKKTGNNSGVVPDFVAEKVVYGNDTGDLSLEYIFTVPSNGIYKVGIMANVDSTCAWGTPSFVVNDLTKIDIKANNVPIAVTAMVDNTSVIDYSNEFEVTDSQIHLSGICSEPRRFVLSYIEIEKIG